MSDAGAWAQDVTELARRGVESWRLSEGQLTVSVVAPSVSARDADLALATLLDRVRAASTRERAREHGAEEGFRIEDAAAIALGLPPGLDADKLSAWLARRMTAACPLGVVVREGPIALAVTLRHRVGFAPDRIRYERQPDGRVRVEAFELHPVEHCNLRCANCCNMSPLLGEHWLSAVEVSRLARRMSEAMVADVVKVMGGEPLLHPDIAQVVWALRESGVGDRVRLFTNGLLLRSMKEEFWESLDELTISSYVSAPVKPAILEFARAKAREHDIVLNVKPVDRFNQVLSPRYEADDERTQRTFERCWLRHRCMVVRGGSFFTCTRAAYAGEFLQRVRHEAPPQGAPLDRTDDGVAIEGAELAERLEAYLNRSAPLAACRYCFGGDGPSEPHYQLSRAEAAAGVLSRKLLVL